MRKINKNNAIIAAVKFAANHSPYYRDFLWAERIRNGKSVQFEDIPLTTRQQFKANTSAFYSTQIPLEHGDPIIRMTSGSTGQPSRLQLTPYHFARNAAENQRLKASANLQELTPTLRIGNPSPLHPEGEWLEETTDERRNFKFRSSFHEEIVAKIDELKPKFLHTYPPILDAIIRDGSHLSDVRVVSTVGSVVPQHVREHINNLRQCFLLDSYGSKETGIMAATCKHCGNYHLAHGTLHTEFLSHTDEALSSQGTAHLYVTPLFNRAMPLVRYEVGDLIETVLPERGCEAMGMSASKILGRRFALFHLEDGTRIMPKFSATSAHELGLKQVKLRQIAYNKIEVLYVTHDPNVSIDSNIFEAVIKKNMSANFQAIPLKQSEIPVVPGKYLEHESVFETAE